MKRSKEKLHAVAEGASEALSKVAPLCKSAAVVKVELLHVKDDRYLVEITKIQSESRGRSLSSVERLEQEQEILARKRNELVDRIRKIDDALDTIACRLWELTS